MARFCRVPRPATEVRSERASGIAASRRQRRSPALRAVCGGCGDPGAGAADGRRRHHGAPRPAGAAHGERQARLERLLEGHARRRVPGGNIGKDLPGWKLPLTPAGEAALQHNLTATIDPESLCIIGGIPRHNASGLPFEILQGANKVVFMYWYSYFRLMPFTPGLKHSDDPDPSFFGEEIGRWEGRYAGHRFDRVQGREGVDRRERQPAQRRAARRRTLDAGPTTTTSTWTRCIEDPKFYTRPFTYARTWVLGEPDEQIQEYSCSENNVDAAHLGFGPGPIRPDGTRGYLIPRRFRRLFPGPVLPGRR